MLMNYIYRTSHVISREMLNVLPNRTDVYTFIKSAFVAQLAKSSDTQAEGVQALSRPLKYVLQ